jgi:hypothetical protein
MAKHAACWKGPALHHPPPLTLQVHGKNLFYIFEERPSPSGTPTAEVVHIHFGMSGAFRTMPLDQEAARPPKVGVGGAEGVGTTTIANQPANQSTNPHDRTHASSAPPKETTRLRLEHPEAGLVAHLSAMTVNHGGFELYEEKVGDLV